ncbi:hypothetical protein PR003_g31646 [Phytophthora rubi]|uniref:Secreted protein n=1 Tax=Phytophthora rubi TaxID=129364 RepID=A0A6A4B6P2_9STRA|nr:hypothetical protein PR002_g30445 [Phytophthora rubi]KAE8959784.1 hypothetical protein PR001_g30598 [Phytophthora rubi]KAE9267835.1 hypothetical protein PR003_g31646 [Phytophthora rubi]
MLGLPMFMVLIPVATLSCSVTDQDQAGKWTISLLTANTSNFSQMHHGLPLDTIRSLSSTRLATLVFCGQAEIIDRDADCICSSLPVMVELGANLHP